MTQPGDVSIIVPVGRAAPHWQRCARSLEGLRPAPGEIIVILDGPGPADAEALQAARRLGATVVELESKMGPAAARNRGAEVAHGEVFFFLDSDVEVPADLIAVLTKHLYASRLGTQGRAVIDGAAEVAAIIGSYDDAPGDPGFVSQYRNLLHHYVHQTSHEKASTFWSGCGAVFRRVFFEVEGFDESYADPSIEDIEFGARVLRLGYGIRLAKSLQISHLKRWTFTKMVHTDLFRRAIPWTEQMLASGGLVNDLNVKTRDRIGVVLAFLVPMLAILVATSLLSPALVGIRIGPTIGAAILSLALLMGLNWRFFAFLCRVRGPSFAARSAPLYWVYLIVCGLGFGSGFVRHWVRRRSSG